MINIKPVSDLRNRYNEIEREVIEHNEPVFLTKNGRGAMVLLSLEQYQALSEGIEEALDEADKDAEENPTRYTLDEVLAQAKAVINGK